MRKGDEMAVMKTSVYFSSAKKSSPKEVSFSELNSWQVNRPQLMM